MSVRDPDYYRLLNTRRWGRLKAAKMRQTGGWCERCMAEGRYVAATEVHHVVPVEWGLSMADKARLCYDPHNLQALCKECHHKAHDELQSHSREGARQRRQAQLERFKSRFLD